MFVRTTDCTKDTCNPQDHLCLYISTYTLTLQKVAQRQDIEDDNHDDDDDDHDDQDDDDDDTCMCPYVGGEVV